MSDALNGLHAAHEATDDQGKPLGIVHRDMSPQNVMVGTDGIARVVDFGIAKAAGRLHTTREGQIKGKLAYMAPEQVTGGQLTRQTDVFATAIVLWEGLTGRRLFRAANDAELLFKVLMDSSLPAPSSVVADLPRALDSVVMRGLERDPFKRFPTAHEMALALEDAAGVIPRRQVSEWLTKLAHRQLEERSKLVAAIESISSEMLDDAAVTTVRRPARTSPAPVAPVEGTPLSSEISDSQYPPKKPRRFWIALVATAAIGVAIVALLALLALQPDHANAPAATPTSTGQSSLSAAAATPSAPSTLAATTNSAPEPRVSSEQPAASAGPTASARAARPALRTPRGSQREKSPESLYSRH